MGEGLKVAGDDVRVEIEDGEKKLDMRDRDPDDINPHLKVRSVHSYEFSNSEFSVTL